VDGQFPGLSIRKSEAVLAGRHERPRTSRICAVSYSWPLVTHTLNDRFVAIA